MVRDEGQEEEDQLISQNNEYFQPLVGTIEAKDQMSFKKLLFRTTRGKAYVQFYPVEHTLYEYSGKPLS